MKNKSKYKFEILNAVSQCKQFTCKMVGMSWKWLKIEMRSRNNIVTFDWNYENSIQFLCIGSIL